jgi:hypothetical protein
MYHVRESQIREAVQENAQDLKDIDYGFWETVNQRERQRDMRRNRRHQTELHMRRSNRSAN